MPHAAKRVGFFIAYLLVRRPRGKRPGAFYNFIFLLSGLNFDANQLENHVK